MRCVRAAALQEEWRQSSVSLLFVLQTAVLGVLESSLNLR